MRSQIIYLSMVKVIWKEIKNKLKFSETIILFASFE